MAKVITFERVNPNAAAIDIGAQKVFMSPDGNNVHCYETFTSDYRRMIGDLKALGIERICMEATGVYWIALYEMLEESGIEVCLVNPKEVKQVKGRKTDPKDCRWIQKMFSAGLVRQSYVPAGKLKELRMVIREREDIISMGGTYVNKMQKCLELMNIKLTEILAQIHGASGIRMIKSILDGQRDPQQLLLLCDKRIIKHKSDEVLKALEGNYNESWLFLLEQNLNMWQLHEQRVLIIDKKIEELLSALEFGKPEVESSLASKPIRHHAPKVQHLHQKLLNIYGADAVSISGINDYTLLRLLGEVGNDMERFPTVKHFVSWCQLAPMQDQSGKMRRRVKMRNGSKAGQIFRDVAHGLLNSKHIAIGSFMRRLRAKKDSRVAVKAGARKLAEAFYNLLTKGANYVEQGVKRYEEQIRHRELLHLERLAKKHNMQLINT